MDKSINAGLSFGFAFFVGSVIAGNGSPFWAIIAALIAHTIHSWHEGQRTE